VSLQVVAVGPSVLVQDRGRPGWAHLGVPRSGALDGPAAALANRLVGNAPDDACLEVLLGGLALTSDEGVWVAVTGARCSLEVDGRPAGFGEADLARLHAPIGINIGAITPAEIAISILAEIVATIRKDRKRERDGATS